MRFVAVKEFEVEIAAGFVGECLKKFAREAEAECTRYIERFFRRTDFLLGKFVQSAPNQIGSPAEINHTAREAFIHRHVSFAGERILRMKTISISADSLFVAERLSERLTERDTAILDRVMRVNFEIAFALQFQINDRVFGKQRKHVVEKRDAGFDRRFSSAVNVQFDFDARFIGVTLERGLALFHGGD